MAKPLSHSALAIADSEETTLSDDLSPAISTLTGIEEACLSLRFHMDNSVWDVIHEEVMDWRDSSWMSMSLPEHKTSLILNLLSWDAQEPTGLANEDGDLRKRILSQMISVQLLATCFTLQQSMNISLPSELYDQKIQTDDTWLKTRLVSSLKQQTQWKYSPAFGHQARNNSTASLWPQRDDALSREALLAEQVSFNRRLRQREDGDSDSKNGAYNERRRQSQQTGEDPKRFRVLPSRYICRLRKSDPASSHQYLQRHCSPRSRLLSSSGRVKYKKALRIIRGLRPRNVKCKGHRWLLEPILRSENHPVFVQPIKDYVMRRCGVFRSRSRNMSSILTLNRNSETSPDNQGAASRTFRKSTKPSRLTQVMTMTRDSENARGKLPRGIAASLNASASKEINPSHQIVQDGTNNVQTTARVEPLISTEHSSKDPFMNGTDYSSSTEWVPRDSLQSPESGPTRNRTSTSGTTIYNPPIITEASPNSEKLESDESTSSSTLSGTRESKSSQEGERPSASARDFEPV